MVLLISAATCVAQESGRAIPTPSPVPEPIRILIEEVQLSVAAIDNQGRIDRALERDDVLVLEEGVPQELRSTRRIPASVILLLDTGGEINSAKRVRVTREVAKQFVSALSPQDQISVMQFNNKIEVLQEWTNDTAAVLRTLDTKLFPGKRSRFLDAVAAVPQQFVNTPPGNRSVVMITDGVQTLGGRVDQPSVIRQLMASNVVVYVISYTTVSRQTTEHDRRLMRPRDKSIVPDVVVESLPTDSVWNPLRRMHEPGGVIVDMDPDRRQQIKDYEKAMRQSEWQLTALARETGGFVWVPETFEEMRANGSQAARLVDSRYVVTYKPKHELASAREGEVRRIDVVSRRVGLNLIARRHFVVPNIDLFSAGAGLDRPRRVRN
jgi:VWFA-related protein